MGERWQTTFRARQAMRATATGALAAAIAAAAFGPVSGALAAPRHRPAPVSAGAGGAPSGWAPVTYRQAQLSVPRLWIVQSPRELWCGPPRTGMIFVGIRPGLPHRPGCRLTASLAWITPAGHIPPGIRHRKPTAVINGIPVYRVRSGPGSMAYLVPKLRVRVGARGPLARRVLATLNRSPLAVVLGRGAAGPVPAGWTWHRFGGVRFAVPASWHLQRENQWATCGTGLDPRSLLLIDATRPPAALPCPFPLPTAAAEQGRPGLTVVTGKYAAKSVSEKFAACRVRHGVRICLASVTGQGGLLSGVLIFSVRGPHQHAATFFLLGLSGSGERARAIFGSVGPGGR